MARRFFAGRSWRVASSIALLLALAVASSSNAATWNPPIALSGSGDGTSVDIATINSLQAVTAYVETSSSSDQLWTRTTANGGSSWSAPHPITSDGQFPALAARGMDVDLVWNSSNGRVHYAHSSDGGATFPSSMVISPRHRFNWVPAVSRGPDGVVAVAYVDAGSGDVQVRVSTNGGTSFGPRSIVYPNGEEQSIAVAVGSGVVYVAYSPSFQQLRVRRSTNGGVNWGAAQTVSNNLWDDSYSMAADGTHAYIAFSRETGQQTFSQVRYRRTLNSGATWSSPISMAAQSWATNDPDLGLANGVLRASFTRCTPDFDVCEDQRVYYRQSSNGTTWGSAQRVSPSSLFDGFDASVGAHRPIVAYVGDDATTIKVFARTK